MRSFLTPCVRNVRPQTLKRYMLSKTSMDNHSARRGIHFASSRFAQALQGIPNYDGTSLRKETVKYMESFDPLSWHKEPMHTIVEGVSLQGGQLVDTIDARSRVNGKQIIADDKAFQSVVSLMTRLSPSISGKGDKPREEYREKTRRMEASLLSNEYACKLVGNQAIDFGKQDGVTEIEESVQANTVERRLNDQLEMDEALGKVVISREPALIACVSNFSNFLDLFRKTIRNIEMGVPVVVLSRSNTSQHCFRWFLLLLEQMKEHQLPLHLATFASTSIEQQREIMRRFPMSPVYFTGSRDVARMIKEVSPRLMASTGGPNTMFTTALTPQVAQAVQMSACIENSGQCTALRHLVAPSCSNAWLEKDVFGSTQIISEPLESVREAAFANLYKGGVSSSASKEAYKAHPSLPAYYKVSPELPHNIQENWRQVYLDVTSLNEEAITSDAFTSKLADWLIKEQPITLSVNGPISLALRMWERTGLAVFSWGTHDKPALSCQARPQDGECFGEFPPRAKLQEFTKFPVIVPTATPGYNTTYSLTYLKTQSLFPCPNTLEFCRPLVDSVRDAHVKGFCMEVLSYLRDAATGPKRGTGARTSLYGLQLTLSLSQQRPPLDGRKTVLVCAPDVTFDDLAPPLLPFYATNARSQVEIHVTGNNPSLVATLKSLQMKDIVIKQTQANDFIGDVYNTVHVRKMDEFPLVGHYLSLFLPIGHCKSVRSEDQEFLQTFSNSAKWLRVTAP